MSGDHPSALVRQEPEGLHGRLVLIVVAGVVLVTIGCVAVVTVMLAADRRKLGGNETAPPYPAAETVGGIEQTPMDGVPRGQERNRRQHAELDRYGWVDREHGVAKIPIERAMEWFVRDAHDGKLRNPDPATAGDDAAVEGAKR